jgi:hypothetical protein
LGFRQLVTYLWYSGRVQIKLSCLATRSRDKVLFVLCLIEVVVDVFCDGCGYAGDLGQGGSVGVS